MIIKVSQLIGQPAISLGDAERRGTVTGVRFEANRIASLDAGGIRIPMDAVRTLEGDTITFEMPADPTPVPADVFADAALTAPLDPLSPIVLPAQPTGSGSLADQQDTPTPAPASDVQEAAPWSGNPIGKLLLTTAGNALGAITEVNVEADGTVTEILDDGGHSHDGSRLMAVGTFAAIITDPSELAE